MQTTTELTNRYLQAAQKGDQQAFGELIKIHEPMLRAINHLSAEPDPEDSDLLAHLNQCRQSLSETNQTLLRTAAVFVVTVGAGLLFTKNLFVIEFEAYPKCAPVFEAPPPLMETSAQVEENGWKKTSGTPLSTFSIDVDTASYTNIRRFLNQGQLPPPDADKVLVRQLKANMVTIAKDVKIQIEFNPSVVRSYRLIGYENRVMAAQDFTGDKKDAGEIGADHQVTALYELITTDAPAVQDGIELKYAQPAEKTYSDTAEMLTLKLRYKETEGSSSKLLTFPLTVASATTKPDDSFRRVAAYGQYLRLALSAVAIPEIRAGILRHTCCTARILRASRGAGWSARCFFIFFRAI